MTDREKVIKGLECCANGNSCIGKCPYDEFGDSWDVCVPQLARDALALLKEQETGGWISVKDAMPENQVTVLVVKELKSGQRNIGLGYCVPECKIHDDTTGEDRAYWMCGGNRVIYWMELPKMPEEVSGDAAEG